MLTVNFVRTEETAAIPAKASAGACAYDLVATSIREDGYYVSYGTGIVLAIPEGYVGLVFPRSSISDTGWTLCNSVGVIDCDFRGELKLRFYKVSGTANRPYNLGQRIGQLVVVELPKLHFQEVSTLNNTSRGNGSFGSTGK